MWRWLETCGQRATGAVAQRGGVWEQDKAWCVGSMGSLASSLSEEWAAASPAGLGARVLLLPGRWIYSVEAEWIWSSHGPVLNCQCFHASWHHDSVTTSTIHCRSDTDASTKNSILPLDWLLRTEMNTVNLSLHHLQEKNCALAWVSLCLHRLNSVLVLFTAGTTQTTTVESCTIPWGKEVLCAVQRWHGLSFSATGTHGSTFGKPCPIPLPVSLSLLGGWLSFLCSLGCWTLGLQPGCFSKV